MRFLILSDSHGDAAALRLALSRARDIDAVLFMGDGIAEAQSLRAVSPVPWYCVRGNCDPAFLAPDVPLSDVLTFEGHRIYLTHGFMEGVKAGDGGLIAAARRADCDVAVCGHTHRAREVTLTDCPPVRYLFNPGSVARPHDGAPTFGRLLLSPDCVLFSVGTLT